VWHRIHRNVFTHREPKCVTEDDVLICTCEVNPETGLGCGPECINRDVLVECDPAFCPCGAACQNQKFSRKQARSIHWSPYDRVRVVNAIP
jgi:histone-lysine N-methyltransferase SETD2